MSIKLRIALLIFSIIWFIIILYSIRKNKLPIKYSLIWILAIFVIVLISVVPFILEYFAKLFGFLTMSSLVIGIMITILLGITLILTIIISHQKKQITLLIQEVSMLKGEVNGK